MNDAKETLKNGLQDALIGIYEANKKIKKATEEYAESLKEMISHEEALEKLGYTFQNHFYEGFYSKEIYSQVELKKIKK